MMTRACRVTVLVLLVCTGVAREGSAQENQPEGGKDIAGIASFVAISVSKLQGNRLAILPFTYLDGSFSVEGRLLADELFMDLAKSGKVVLLERAQVRQNLAEQKLSAANLTRRSPMTLENPRLKRRSIYET